MRNKKEYQIILPVTHNEERFSNYYCYYLFWVAVGYYLWKKILAIIGYRFHPTDFELLHYYLQNKNLGRDALVQAIAEVEDICGLEPWELPAHSNIHSGDQVWYFFYRPNYKYRNSTRMKRTTNEGYWKPTGNPRKVMARDLETEIGKKRTLVFYRGRVSDNIKNNTGWIMHEYELTATLPNQTTFVLCKLKKKYGKDEVQCIEEDQSIQYLPPNLGDYIVNNEIQAEAARCLTDQWDPSEMLKQLQVFNAREGLELLRYPSTESWNSYLVDDVSKDESSNLPLNFGNHSPENAFSNDQLNSSEVPMEQGVPQYHSGTSEQHIESNDERSNQHNNSVPENHGSTTSNLKNPAAEDSVFMALSNMDGESTDELFAEIEGLPEANFFMSQFVGNGFWEAYDDWISVDIFRKPEIPNASRRSNLSQSGSGTNDNEDQTFSSAESPFPINHPSRKRSRHSDYEGPGLHTTCDPNHAQI